MTNLGSLSFLYFAIFCNICQRNIFIFKIFRVNPNINSFCVNNFPNYFIYLLCRTELREHTNKSVSDLHLNDDAVQILTDEKYNPQLLSELLSHESFHKFITDLEIYIDGFNDKGIQIANAFLDVMRYKLNELGGDSTDVFTKIFDTSPTQIATEDTSEASNDAYINGLLLLFCKNLEMKITQLSVEEQQTLKEIFSRSKPAKEQRKLRRRNPKL